MLLAIVIVPVRWGITSNLKVNSYSVTARFSLRHRACGIMRWSGELIKAVHDGFPALFPRKRVSLLTCDVKDYIFCVLKICRHQTVTCYQSPIINFSKVAQRLLLLSNQSGEK